jgi:recombinational DNA repair protein (RecF pathway)
MSAIESLARPCHGCHTPTPVVGGYLLSGDALCPACWTWHTLNVLAQRYSTQEARP